LHFIGNSFKRISRLLRVRRRLLSPKSGTPTLLSPSASRRNLGSGQGSHQVQPSGPTVFDHLQPGALAVSPATRGDAERISTILEPIAKDSGSNLSIAITGNIVLLTVNATIVHSERANVVQNAARRFLDPTVSPQGQLEREVMYLQQICGDLKSKVGGREVIEKFSTKPVKPYFMTPEVKASIIENPENFFKMAYVVDGRVDTVEGKPTLYKITVVRDAFDRPLGAGAAQCGLAPNTGHHHAPYLS
jgi:hypothetical protein